MAIFHNSINFVAYDFHYCIMKELEANDMLQASVKSARVVCIHIITIIIYSNLSNLCFVCGPVNTCGSQY